MHPYINQQLIDDRHRRLHDEAEAHRLLTPPRPRRRWLRRAQRPVPVPPEVEATTPPPSIVADDPKQPAA
jgi:hypothetical protein